ncbi:hypothetical protein FB548_2188 [Pseudoxanthomonas sp. 3HH-4]|nr:hypothetical protein FB548_2188 [Pseudoxanthomonas sp. 3HH-4]
MHAPSSSLSTVGTDMRAISFGILVLLPLLASCQAEDRPATEAGSARPFCGVSKASEADPCHVSIYTLAAHPDYFDGKFVRISGFYTKGLMDVLFFDRDSSENVILKNAVALLDTTPQHQEKLTLRLNRYVEVVGKFSQTIREPGEFSGPSYGQFLGTLNVVKVGSALNTHTPYACWDPQRDRARDPKTVRALLGEQVCNEAPPAEPAPSSK